MLTTLMSTQIKPAVGIMVTSAQPIKLGWGSKGANKAEEACVDSLSSSVITLAPSLPQERPGLYTSLSPPVS